MRIDGRTDCEHLRFNKFVGTLPSQVSRSLVSKILSPIVLAYIPIPAESKIEYGKSLSGAKPDVETAPGEVTCRLGRLILVAEWVKELKAVDNHDGTETLTWIQERKVRYDRRTGDEIEITPERVQSMTVERRSEAIA